MTHAEATDSVRRLIADVFQQLRLSDADATRESLLIREGNYCGRRFEADRGHALWFFEEDQVKVFGTDSRVLRVIERACLYSAATKMAA